MFKQIQGEKNMNWNNKLTENGDYSIAPDKLLLGNSQIGMAPRELLLILKINRHDERFNQHHYYIDEPNKNKYDDKKKRKTISGKISNIIKSCKKKRFLKAIKQYNGTYNMGFQYDFTNLNRLITEKIKIPNLKIWNIIVNVENTRWTQENIEYGFLMIPNILLDRYRDLEISEKEIIVLLQLLTKKQGAVVDIDLFNLDKRTLVKHWDSLQDKKLITYENIYDDKYEFNFQFLEMKLIIWKKLDISKKAENLITMADKTAKPLKHKKIGDNRDNILLLENNSSGQINNIINVISDHYNNKISSLHKDLLDKFNEFIDTSLHTFQKDISAKLNTINKEIKLLKTQTFQHPPFYSLSVPPKKFPKYEDIENITARRMLYKYNKTMKYNLREGDIKYLKNKNVLSKLKSIEDCLIAPIINSACDYMNDKKIDQLPTLHLPAFVRHGVLDWMYRKRKILY